METALEFWLGGQGGVGWLRGVRTTTPNGKQSLNPQGMFFNTCSNWESFPTVTSREVTRPRPLQAAQTCSELSGSASQVP